MDRKILGGWKDKIAFAEASGVAPKTTDSS